MSIRPMIRFSAMALALAITVTLCGCTCNSHKTYHITASSKSSVIFDYPNTAARYQYASGITSEDFTRYDWPVTSVPTGYVSGGELAGYHEYSIDYQRIGSDNTPRQYYRQRTHTFRTEYKSR